MIVLEAVHSRNGTKGAKDILETASGIGRKVGGGDCLLFARRLGSSSTTSWNNNESCVYYSNLFLSLFDSLSLDIQPLIENNEKKILVGRESSSYTSVERSNPPETTHCHLLAFPTLDLLLSLSLFFLQSSLFLSSSFSLKLCYSSGLEAKRKYIEKKEVEKRFRGEKKLSTVGCYAMKEVGKSSLTPAHTHTLPLTESQNEKHCICWLVGWLEGRNIEAEFLFRFSPPRAD